MPDLGPASGLGLTPENRAADPQSKIAVLRAMSTAPGSPGVDGAGSMAPSLSELITLDADQPAPRLYTSPPPDQAPGSPLRTSAPFQMTEMTPVTGSAAADPFIRATQRQKKKKKKKAAGPRPPSNLAARSATEDDYEDDDANGDDALLLLSPAATTTTKSAR